MRTIVWFRGKDLRLADHEPLRQAVAAGEMIPLFVIDPYFFAPERARRIPHRMQFLIDSLAELADSVGEAPDDVLRAAGVELDRTYPRPIVDHRLARERYLAVATAHLGRQGRDLAARSERERSGARCGNSASDRPSRSPIRSPYAV